MVTSKHRRNAFTLIEVLIVVVIMAVLAATIIPQFADSTKDAKVSTIKYNLHTLRSQIELYRTQHDGVVPSATLLELTIATDVSGSAGGPLGPYVRDIPENPFTNNNAVKVIASSPATGANVTAGNAGWLYNTTTGDLYIDHADYYTE